MPLRHIKMVLRISIIVCCITCSGSAQESAVKISVNKGTTYQTIEGFGAHGAMDVWWEGGPFFNQAFLDRMIDDLGLTIVRNEYYPPDDNQCNFAKQTPYLRAMKEKAAASGEPLKFIATFWSPPAAFKDNNSIKQGGRVLPEHYADLGKYAVSAIAAYKDIGIDLYALSLQNEPNFKEPYNSCVYNPGQYRDMLKAAGPIIKQAFPNTFRPENL